MFEPRSPSQPDITVHKSSNMSLVDNEPKETLPSPAYRHAAPSGPWPWIDADDPIDPKQLSSNGPTIPPPCDHKGCSGRCWKKYPQSRFPNWTKAQVKKCGIEHILELRDSKVRCEIHQLDVDEGGIFHPVESLKMHGSEEPDIWKTLLDSKPGSGIRVRALFIEKMNASALKMLGAKYDIEPFFFSSSLNRIPTRFQEDLKKTVGDHITITIPFIRSVTGTHVEERPPPWYRAHTRLADIITREIDVQAPLPVKVRRLNQKDFEDRNLVLDLLSVHLIRNKEGNTIISYHGDRDCTQAHKLHEKIRYAGQSVYWQKMLSQDEDPTLLLLIFVWHTIYAWDGALGDLYDHIRGLEGTVTKTTAMEITGDLHTIQAHLLNYSSLLNALQLAVTFIKTTPNPVPVNKQRKAGQNFLQRECEVLKHEIERMKDQRTVQEDRVKNLINFVFTGVTILDNKTTIRDSAYALKMRQIAWLTMIFLPATFATGIFGMNVDAINPGTKGTVGTYLATALPLTTFAIWALIAFESRYLFRNQDTSLSERALWPILLPFWIYGWEKERRALKAKHSQDASSQA